MRKDGASIHENSTIENVAAADFNYDGKLDILVSGPNNDLNHTMYIHIYFGDYNQFGKKTTSMLHGLIILKPINHSRNSQDH